MPDDPRPDEPATESTAVAESLPESSPPAEEAEGGAPARAKLVQTVVMDDIGPCKKHIKVTIDRTSIDKRLDAKYKEIVPDANVAGFRPGKAPRALVVRRYAKEVGDQVKGELLLESLEQLAEEHDVAPLAAPNIDPLKIELPKTGPMVYEFVEVRAVRPAHRASSSEAGSHLHRRGHPQRGAASSPRSARSAQAGGDAQLGDVLVATVTNKDGVGPSAPSGTTIRVERLAFKDGIAPKFLEQVRAARGQLRGGRRLSDATADQTCGKRFRRSSTSRKSAGRTAGDDGRVLQENFGVASATPSGVDRVVLNREPSTCSGSRPGSRFCSSSPARPNGTAESAARQAGRHQPPYHGNAVAGISDEDRHACV
jgi:trigger factor